MWPASAIEKRRRRRIGFLTQTAELEVRSSPHNPGRPPCPHARCAPSATALVPTSWTSLTCCIHPDLITSNAERAAAGGWCRSTQTNQQRGWCWETSVHRQRSSRRVNRNGSAMRWPCYCHIAPLEVLGYQNSVCDRQWDRPSPSGQVLVAVRSALDLLFDQLSQPVIRGKCRIAKLVVAVKQEVYAHRAFERPPYRRHLLRRKGYWVRP